MDELNTSQLGTQEYWNEHYKLEVQNFRDNGELGDCWFGEESVQRICRWILKQNKINKDSKIIDIGCGNGMLLLELARYEYTNLYGVDYSEEGIILAKEISEKGNFNITYNVVDILKDRISDSYNVAHDKGTYDAISLSQNAKENRELYINNVYNLLEPEGFFIITSCNWTQSELEEHFKDKFCLFYVIPTPQFKFGGLTGNSVTSLVFNKIL